MKGETKFTLFNVVFRASYVHHKKKTTKYGKFLPKYGDSVFNLHWKENERRLLFHRLGAALSDRL